MTLEQLTEIAEQFGLKVRRNASLQSIIYDILDSQADKRGAEVQAREEAKQAKQEEKKRNKRARIQNAPTKVNTDNLKSNRVMATVGNEQETLGQIKEEQAKQPVPKPVVSAQQPNIFDAPLSTPERDAEDTTVDTKPNTEHNNGNDQGKTEAKKGKKGLPNALKSQKVPPKASNLFTMWKWTQV